MTDTKTARETIEYLSDERYIQEESALRLFALCDEVEALRAKVPEVLREWPAKADDAPGQWAHFTQDGGIRVGRFLGLPHMGGHVVVFERTNNRTIRLPDAFRPGEFFVRVPA